MPTPAQHGTLLNPENYTTNLPPAFLCAYWWSKYAPRGKGWLPRRIGRSVGRNMACSVRTRSGANLAVDPFNLDFYCLVKARDGVWEEDVLDACLRVLRPEDVFYDIGANAGIVTLDVAQTFRDKVTIHSFEPQPTLARALRISIASNGFKNVTLHEILLGDDECETDLFIADHGIHTSLIAREQGATPISRPMKTLDSLVANGELPPPTVVKIDVEGAELKVLNGGRQTLRASRPTIIFEADENMPRFGYTHRELFGLLSEFGDYSFYHINGSGLDLMNDPSTAALGNYLALPGSRAHLLNLR